LIWELCGYDVCNFLRRDHCEICVDANICLIPIIPIKCPSGCVEAFGGGDDNKLKLMLCKIEITYKERFDPASL